MNKFSGTIRILAILVLFPVCAMAQIQTWEFSGTTEDPFVSIEGGYQDAAEFIDYKNSILGVVTTGDLFQGALLVDDDYHGSGNTAVYGLMTEWTNGMTISGGSMTDTAVPIDVRHDMPFFMTGMSGHLPGVEDRHGEFYLESDHFYFQYWSSLMIDNQFVQTIVTINGTIDEFCTAASVPEPSTFVMLCFGCLTLAGRRRKLMS